MRTDLDAKESISKAKESNLGAKEESISKAKKQNIQKVRHSNKTKSDFVNKTKSQIAESSKSDFVNISKSEDIDDWEYCKSDIEKFPISDFLTKIPPHAFFSCVFLDNIVIPSTVKVIGKSAFYECKSLTKIKFSKNNPNL